MSSKGEAFEVNFDGIVGPTHNYSGLSYGNIASQLNQYSVSNPREAALQGLEKMKFLADCDILQAVLPPHERPHLPTLKKLGFLGSNRDILTAALHQAPEVLIAVSSAAAMWTANAATICPSSDSGDNLLHMTPANLFSKFHRSIEDMATGRFLRKIFSNPRFFMHHSPLPGVSFTDEGAANHTRFCNTYGSPGVHFFVFGRYALQTNLFAPQTFPARQTFEASQAIARLHKINSQQVVFAQQHPLAIDAGAFHNDVVSVGNCNVFFFHELAFLNKEKLIEEIQEKVLKTCNCKMIFIEVKNHEIPLEQAVGTYLFNSQLINLTQGKMALIAPIECQENNHVRSYLETLINSGTTPIKHVHYLNLRQSMRNGGGPACLRLRIVLNKNELSAALPSVFFKDDLYIKLTKWIKKHYRDSLHPKELADPQLTKEVLDALDELTQILNLGPIYDFQS